MRIPLYYNARSLAVRRLSTGVTVLGLALVAFVLGAVLMLSHGVEAALRSGGRHDNAVVLRQGVEVEIVSAIGRDAVSAIAASPEIASGPGGRPIAAGEVVVLVALNRDAGSSGAFINVSARGVREASWIARPSVRVVEGRMPRPGTDEIAIGSALAGVAPRARVGGRLSFARTEWPVVGRIEAGGAAFESEIWADEGRLGQAFGRAADSSMIARLGDASRFDAFRARIEADPRWSLKVMREDAYWAEQPRALATFIRVLGLFVSLVFGLGAVLGAMITMYAQVAARTRELATLRAIGFPRRSVLASVIVESALLGAAGGILGAAAAWSMRFVQMRTLNFQTFSDIRFGFTPTPGILLGCVAFGIAMGLAGGLLPAARAARLPILEAIRR